MGSRPESLPWLVTWMQSRSGLEGNEDAGPDVLVMVVVVVVATLGLAPQHHGEWGCYWARVGRGRGLTWRPIAVCVLPQPLLHPVTDRDTLSPGPLHQRAWPARRIWHWGEL